MIGGLDVVPSETYEGPLAAGDHPQNDVGLTYLPVAFGCDGNDAEMVCAPGVPSAIISLTGTVVDGRFLVDAAELAADPTAETVTEARGEITLRSVEAD